MTLVDQKERLLATDPNLSCIVQAPAGSGKTEILTQRFLRLLARVNKPEEIVALTFTRKAANEMRERILYALSQAAQGNEPTLPHQQLTYQYACEALSQDQKKHWQLLQMPTRLRVTTIDSLCQTLANAIPLQEKQTPYAKICETPQILYQQAAFNCFQHALKEPQYQSALMRLLTHFDNRQDLLLQVLTEQLATRLYWLPLIYQAKFQDKAQFESALSSIETHEIQRFKKSIPHTLHSSLVALARTAATIENNPHSPRFPLCELEEINQLDRRLIQALANLLLTAQNTLRKSFDHHVGVRKDACSAETFQQIKAESKALLENLEEDSNFLAALLRVKLLPSTIYPELEWQTLQALLTLLPSLAAHLQLVFQESNEVDFSAIAHLAQSALYVDGSPTDLALYLDHAIHHLLIDEFQDTSIQQFELIQQLVQGFDDPQQTKTLFLVGDPMQSIYRFRNAEVGLFLRAKHQGIGPIKPHFLQLHCNFRSNELIVNWINQQFQTIFPPENDMELGAVTFHSATPIHPIHNDAQISAYQYGSKDEEAAALVEKIQYELIKYPQEKMAILVRSRHQLSCIIQALRDYKIPYQGVDIDWLTALPHIQDVWTITQALLKPAYRLAWIALLRSPWCGLSLQDLHHLANIDRKKSIYHVLSQEDSYIGLTEEGRIRARFVFHILKQAILQRAELSLVDWILSTLKALHINNILTPLERSDINQFLTLLSQYEKEGQIAHWDQFRAALNTLFSKQMTPSPLQIMTIHKSKGLEFDCVFLPSLGAKIQSPDRPLLRWLMLPSEQEPLILVSPLKASDQDKSEIYAYLNSVENEKEFYENQRLLYVAATRAKKRLYLTDYHDSRPKGSFKAFLSQQIFETQETLLPNVPTELPKLKRLPLSYYNHIPIISKPTAHTRFILTDQFARIIGIATHELLQWICTYHPKLTDIPWHLPVAYFKQKGLTLSQIETAMLKVRNYIQPLFSNSRGLWLIQPHQEEKNEYALLIKKNQEIQTRIIDRTFIDQNICWIIDFKTGQEEKTQEKNHRAQLEEYAQHLPTNLPIHCGLYYLAEHHWVEWAYTEPVESSSYAEN